MLSAVRTHIAKPVPTACSCRLLPVAPTSSESYPRSKAPSICSHSLAFRAIPELERLGVARLSVGTRLALNAISALDKTARELATAGSYDAMFEGASTSFVDANCLMATRKGQ